MSRYAQLLAAYEDACRRFERGDAAMQSAARVVLEGLRREIDHEFEVALPKVRREQRAGKA